MMNEPAMQARGSMIEEIRGLYGYNRWANDRILDVTAVLSAEELSRDLRSSFPSVRDTLIHMVAAEWIWLSRWNVATHAAMRARFDDVDRARTAFLDRLDDEALHRVVAYRNTRGQAFENPLWQLLRHVVNHATYHRGQVTTMVRQLGRDAISTDLAQYYRER
jgi:uncharacterized damage-inducible protein DinB